MNMRYAIFGAILTLALPGAALAQWTPLGGGDHAGWDYSPPNGAVVGSDSADHSGINVFTILSGNTISSGGVAATVVIRGQTVVLDGNLDAVVNPVRIDAETTTTAAGSIPTLISPAHGGFGPATPVWDWNDVSGLPTDNYVLQVSPVGVAGPGGTVTGPYTLEKTTGFTGSSYVTLGPEALTDGLYYWRVGRDDDNDGTIAGAEVWSEVWQVNIDTTPPTVPVLLSPPDGAYITDSTPFFDWTDSFDINGVTYTIVVDNDPFFLSPEINVSGLAVSNYTPGAALPFDPMQYFWYVIATDPAGNVATSGTFDFTLDTVPPPVPGLLLPPNGSFTNDNTPTFDWDDAALGDPNFANYTIQVDNSGAGFPSPEINQSAVVPSTYTPGAGLADGTYWWRVIAYDLAGNNSTSAVWTVTIDTIAPAAFSLLLPPNASFTNDNTPTFDWTDSSDVNGFTYRIQADNSGAGFPSPEIDVAGLAVSTYTPGVGLADGTYSWRVYAIDPATNQTVSAVWTVTIDTALPGAPTLLLPPNASLANDSTPLYDWTDVVDPSGVTYQIQVDNSGAGYPSPEINVSGLAVSTYTPGVGLADGTYTWHARATDGAGNVGAWSANFTHTIDTLPPPTPLLVTPIEFAMLNITSIPLDWTNSTDPNGVTYVVQVDNDPAFGSLDYTSSPAVSNATTGPLAVGTYYWRARAVDGAGNQSAWSAVWSFTIDTTAPIAPILTAPADTSLVAAGPTCDWNPVAGETGESYEIWVDNEAGFLAPRSVEATTTADLQAVGPLVDGGYWWRVRCIDAAGNVGPWSTVWTFTVDATPPTLPVLLTPPNLSVVGVSPVAFDWTDSVDASGVDHYEIQVYNSAPFLVHAANTSASADSVGGLADDTFTWRVRAIDILGNTGAWTGFFTFTKTTGLETVPPTVPTLVSPPDTSVIATSATTLVWNASTDNVAVAYYIVELDDSPGFEAPMTLQTTTASTSQVTPALVNGVYVWRVQAVDVNGNMSGWSAVWSFTIAVTDTAGPSVPVLLLPINGANLPPGAIAFDWTDSTDDIGISNYDLEVYSIDAFGAATLVFSTTVVPSTATSGALPAGVYEWRVRARDTSANVSAFSGFWAFSLDAGAPVDVTAPAAPAPIFPLTGFTGPDPFLAFQWTAVADPSGIASYFVEVFSPGPTPFWSGYTAGTSLTNTVALQDGVTYTWRVRATDGAGNVGPTSAVQTFTMNYALDTSPPSIPVKVSPADTSTVAVGVVPLTWLPSVDDNAVSYYEFEVDDDISFLSPITHGAGTALTATTADLPLGDYYWRVRAIDYEGNASGWSGPWLFHVGVPPPPPPPPPGGGGPGGTAGEDGSGGRGGGSGCGFSVTASRPDHRPLALALLLALAAALWAGRRGAL